MNAHPGLDLTIAHIENVPVHSPKLFHRHRLGQIPRLVDIRPLQHRDMVAQQLQRDRVDDGGNDVGDLGHFDDLQIIGLFGFQRLVHKHDQLAAAGANFLHVGFEFLQ